MAIMPVSMVKFQKNNSNVVSFTKRHYSSDDEPQKITRQSSGLPSAKAAAVMAMLALGAPNAPLSAKPRVLDVPREHIEYVTNPEEAEPNTPSFLSIALQAMKKQHDEFNKNLIDAKQFSMTDGSIIQVGFADNDGDKSNIEIAKVIKIDKDGKEKWYTLTELKNLSVNHISDDYTSHIGPNFNIVKIESEQFYRTGNKSQDIQEISYPEIANYVFSKIFQNNKAYTYVPKQCYVCTDKDYHLSRVTNESINHFSDMASEISLGNYGTYKLKEIKVKSDNNDENGNPFTYTIRLYSNDKVHKNPADKTIDAVTVQGKDCPELPVKGLKYLKAKFEQQNPDYIYGCIIIKGATGREYRYNDGNLFNTLLDIYKADNYNSELNPLKFENLSKTRNFYYISGENNTILRKPF